MLGTGMMIFGVFGTMGIAGRALNASSFVWAARVGQVLAVASVLVFLFPYIGAVFRFGAK